MNLFEYDAAFRLRSGCAVLCGVDEAGRGPLAGPVCAAAVILPEGCVIDGLNDSKKLTEKKREALFPVIVEHALAYSVAWADESEIDTLNILGASLLAMRRAVSGLARAPQHVLVDGNRLPATGLPETAVVSGDATSASIAAASVLAKVSRDRYMLALDREYPQYAFAKHKGYPTVLHYRMLEEHGPCPAHRRTFLKKKSAAARGSAGEAYACELLRARGCEILARNVHSRYGEVDIIARDGETVCFVEVKTRKHGAYITGQEAVTPAKQKKIIQTALEWMDKTNCILQPRFDVAALTVDASGAVAGCEYLKGAFDGEALEAAGSPL